MILLVGEQLVILLVGEQLVILLVGEQLVILLLVVVKTTTHSSCLEIPASLSHSVRASHRTPVHSSRLSVYTS